MYNVSRPLFVLLNNRFCPEGLGSSLDLEEVPPVGRLHEITVQNLQAEDGPEMEQPHLRFNDDLMGAPWFNGIRFDAAQGHEITGVTLDNLRYRTAGGVALSQIPSDWPEVAVQTTPDETPQAGNYYPDWSRAAFLDMRNVGELILSNICLSAQHPDEREACILEHCHVLKQEVYVL